MSLHDQLTLVPARTEAAALAEQLGVAETHEAEPTSQPLPEQATVLFVDVVDSTRLTEELGDVEYRDRARRLEQRLRLVVAEHDGAAMPGINLGDGLLALFSSARPAVDTAIAAVDAAREGSLRLHLGLHQGAVLRERNATYGRTVNAAARICAQSSPDEILVSDALHRTLTRADAPGLAFVDRGRHRLKGIAEEQQLFAVVPLD